MFGGRTPGGSGQRRGPMGKSRRRAARGEHSFRNSLVRAGLGAVAERSCAAKMDVWLAGRVGRWLARLGGRCVPALSSQLPPGGVEPQHSEGLGVGRWPVQLGSPAEFAGAAARSAGGQRVGGWVLPCFQAVSGPLSTGALFRTRLKARTSRIHPRIVLILARVCPGPDNDTSGLLWT